MLTLQNLLVISDPKYLNSVYRVDLYKVTENFDNLGNYIHVIGVLSEASKSKKCSIKCYSKEITELSPVKVYCSCDLFKSRYETLLAEKGSAELRDRRLPKTSNPSFKLGLCPHLIFMAKVALKANKNDKNNVKGPRISNRLKRKT